MYQQRRQFLNSTNISTLIEVLLFDYFDAKLVCYFFKELSKFIYKNRGVFILVDPYLIENLRDANSRWYKEL
ncbi:peptidoglycan bridge formation glycyltransferase FemA/FemB family protein [Staphylococcus aureus]